MKLIRVKIILISLFILGALVQTSIVAEAQDKKDKKSKSVNFEDELIEGEVKKPELFYLLQRRQFNFKRLIKLRENFLPEMRSTTEELQRGKVD